MLAGSRHESDETDQDVGRRCEPGLFDLANLRHIGYRAKLLTSKPGCE